MSQYNNKLFDRILKLNDANTPNLEDEVWREFGCQRAVLIMDSTGFTRITKSHGIVHYLGLLAQIRRTLGPLLDAQGSLRTRMEADNIYAEYESVEQALKAALEVNKTLDQVSVPLTETEKFGICSGIGFGQMLDSGHEGLYGAQMNLASKLGEDTAESGEILLTEEAWNALPEDTQSWFEQHDQLISGNHIPYFSMQALEASDES